MIGAGRTVFLAGQTALDHFGRIVGKTVVEQFEQAFGNLLTALAAAGGSPSDLPSLTIYIVDMVAHKAESTWLFGNVKGRAPNDVLCRFSDTGDGVAEGDLNSDRVVARRVDFRDRLHMSLRFPRSSDRRVFAF